MVALIVFMYLLLSTGLRNIRQKEYREVGKKGQGRKDESKERIKKEESKRRKEIREKRRKEGRSFYKIIWE